MEKTKILFMAANPLDTRPLALDKEISTIIKSLRDTPLGSDMEPAFALHAHPRDWLQELNRHHPRIVHFGGHGTSGGKLQLVGSDDNMQLVSFKALKGVFHTMEEKIRLACFSACYSRKQAEEILEEVDCVVGMSDKIHDGVAIAFFAAFYSALGFGRSVQTAFDQGKAALPLEGLEGEHIPELLTRPGVNPSEVRLANISQRGPEASGAISLFYCYDPKDKEFCVELERQLIVMRRHGLIKSVDSQDLQGGDVTKEKIQRKLEEAQIILLMVSPDFLISDDIYEIQLQQAMERHESGSARVIPIIVRRTLGWEKEWFGKLFPLPKGGKPVSTWKSRDDALYSVAEGIREVVERMKTKE